MDPLVGLLIPSPTGGDDVQVRVVLTVAPMSLNDYDIAPFERLTTDPAEEIIQALHATAHQLTQQLLGMLIKRVSEDIGHRQHDVTVDDTVVQHLTDLADPVINVDFGTA